MMQRGWLGSMACLVGLLVAAPASAQVKIGVVDLQRALQSVNDGKKAKGKLEKEVHKRQKDFDRMQDDLKKLKDELEQKIAVMTEDVKRQKLQDYQRRLMEVQDYYLNNQRELAEMEQNLTRPIFERFHRILQEIGAKENFTLIVDRQAVVFSDAGTDLTERLIQEYNAGKGK